MLSCFLKENNLFIIVQPGDRGRKSIRLSSHLALEENSLVIIDLEHMPTTSGATGTPQGCSLWPAFWTFGPQWPNSGEIDIIEYVNTDAAVLTSLHTSAGCDESRESTTSFAGTWGIGEYNQPNDNCDVNAPDQYSNSGCGIEYGNAPVGAKFNGASNGKGGVFVMEWSSIEIRAFYFPRETVPADILAHSPIPDSWGLPYARYIVLRCFFNRVNGRVSFGSLCVLRLFAVSCLLVYRCTTGTE
jgi:hypothetical protein